jgi:hypothetical protein
VRKTTALEQSFLSSSFYLILESLLCVNHYGRFWATFCHLRYFCLAYFSSSYLIDSHKYKFIEYPYFLVTHTSQGQRVPCTFQPQKHTYRIKTLQDKIILSYKVIQEPQWLDWVVCPWGFVLLAFPSLPSTPSSSSYTAYSPGTMFSAKGTGGSQESQKK